MKVIAGILLILVAVINLFAGFGYTIGGGAASYLGSNANELTDAALAAGGSAENVEVASSMVAGGALLVVFGVFLLILVGLEIAAAVFCFQSKKAKFITIIAGLEGVALIAGIFTSGFGITSIISILAIVFAFLAAKAIGTLAIPDVQEA